MTIEKIIIHIADYFRRTHQAPKSNEMVSVKQECHRKIGTWRSALWLAGVIADERKKQLPQLSFSVKDNNLILTLDAQQKLKEVIDQQPGVKEKIS
jgi:uncharacterized protein YktB (UPF0637 family)